MRKTKTARAMAGKRRVPRPRRASYERLDRPLAITPIEYGGLQEAYDHFNAALFDGGLPDVMITLQRKSRSMGYFAPDRFSGRIAKFARHELALNPDSFVGQTDEQVCQTLVHEMAHCWQQAHGTPPRRGYHDAQWAGKMKAIGLQPSSTGAVGGKEVGQHMLDYIIPGGPFARAVADPPFQQFYFLTTPWYSGPRLINAVGCALTPPIDDTFGIGERCSRLLQPLAEGTTALTTRSGTSCLASVAVC